ncbi:MAG: DNA repair protein RadC [Alistipes sp.]|nr:DNA repair protein RadC [Alistipes sp.]
MKNLHDKLLSRGAASLSDTELLALLVESADDRRDPIRTAENLIAAYGSLAAVAHAEIGRLRMSEGLGLRRAERIRLATELGRRATAATAAAAATIATDTDVVRLMRPLLDAMGHEECWAIFLTSSNRIIEYCRMSQGGVQATIVDHRIIVKRALELLATQIILVHNHPSGAASPSEADRTLTLRIRDAAALFDIRLTDHIIISREGEFSFRRAAML